MAANPLFFEFTIIMVIATIVSIVMRLLRQPALIGYILTGILVSPVVFGIIRSEQTVAFLSEVGIAFLLFIVGLNLNLRDLRNVGLTSTATGLAQVTFTFTIAFFASLALGFSVIEAAYLGIALAFSSTIIILKLLTDRQDTDTLYGKISIGFLLVQDFVAVIALTLIASLTETVSPGFLALIVVVKIAIMMVAAFLLMRYVVPRIDAILTRTHEILFIFSITWLLIFSAVFMHFGFSLEIGALMAGLMFSLSPHRFEIRERVKPLRDFFIILFFIKQNILFCYQYFFFYFNLYSLVVGSSCEHILKSLLHCFLFEVF